jgi:hypothetical protein
MFYTGIAHAECLVLPPDAAMAEHYKKLSALVLRNLAIGACSRRRRGWRALLAMVPPRDSTMAETAASRSGPL